MPVLINFKICDNSEECSGVERCLTGALSWDAKNKSIKIDNSKCTSCGACEKACEVFAIQVARNEQEYKQIKQEIEEDQRTVTDLHIDRFGAQPILSANLISEDEFELHVLHAQQTVCVEFFKEETIECMIKSIPIKDLLRGYSIKYRKMKVPSDKMAKRFEINKLPALLFFKKGKLLGRVEGYYNLDQIQAIKDQINKILQ